MSESGLYCIYDRVAEEAAPPFVARTDGVAIRQFMAALSQAPVSKDEFRLYKIGVWNPSTMNVDGIAPLDIPISSKAEVEV